MLRPACRQVSNECIRVALTKLRSEVVLPKETLLTAGQVCMEVFCLVRGVLNVKPGEESGGGKGGKGKVQPVERMGALLGMRDPFEKDFRYPFQVTALKQVQVAALSGKDLLEVFMMDNRADIELICDTLEKEHNDLVKTLAKQQPLRKTSSAQRSQSIVSAFGTEGGGPRRSSVGAGLLGREDDEIHTRVALVEDNVRQVFAEIKGLTEDLNLLPQLCEKLMIDLEAIEQHAPAMPLKRG